MLQLTALLRAVGGFGSVYMGLLERRKSCVRKLKILKFFMGGGGGVSGLVPMTLTRVKCFLSRSPATLSKKLGMYALSTSVQTDT